MTINAASARTSPRPEKVLLWLSIIVAMISTGLLVAAAVSPVSGSTDTFVDRGPRHIPPLPQSAAESQALVRRMAGSRMIRPSQVQAAVKDSGAAERLRQQLRLTGIVDSGDGLVAYIAVKGQATGGKNATVESIRAVREGEKILDFVVEKISTADITLNLEGVVVPLRYE